jgi:hypothetical protein
MRRPRFIEEPRAAAKRAGRARPGSLLRQRMSRVPAASIAGICFVVAWISGAAVLADYIFRLNFALQVLYFAVAGFVWVFPVRWLMLWAVHQR